MTTTTTMTLTNTELDQALEQAGIPNHPAGRLLAQALGHTVVDDDVPTNAERLTPFIAAVIREAALGAEHSEGADYWAKRLDLAGVRAPETVSEIRSQALREAAHDFDHNIGVSSTDDEGADELHHNEFVAFLENLAEGG